MRTLNFAITAALGLLIGASGLAAQIAPAAQSAQSAQSAPAAQSAQITQLPYPAEVSLVQEPKGWTYRQNSTNLPLYLYEPASARTVCKGACEQQWLPLLVPANEKPLGDWTIFVRSDGRAQWAFQQHPVYTHRHDTPAHAAGARVGGAWHLMPHFPS